MRIWDIAAAEQSLEELKQSAAALKVAQQQQPHLSHHGRRAVVQDAYRALLEAMEGMTPGDLNAEAASFMDMDVGGQTAIFGSVEKAIAVMQLVEKHADRWPAHQAQGWGYKLRRVLCFFAGTSLIELATALGIPPYLGRVRVLLIALHWATAVMIL
ncbi:hypothetical protein ABPG77_003107 [Micractinium sp. CCAP 211/92]